MAASGRFKFLYVNIYKKGVKTYRLKKTQILIYVELYYKGSGDVGRKCL